MRLISGVLLALALLLAGCAAEGPDERAAAPTGTGPVEFDQVAVVAAPAAGGVVDPRAVDLTDERTLAEFLGQFEGGRMATALDETIAGAEVGPGRALAGAVVAIGCLPPAALSVEVTDAGLEVAAVPDKSAPAVECLLPVTSVGVVEVDASLL